MIAKMTIDLTADDSNDDDCGERNAIISTTRTVSSPSPPLDRSSNDGQQKKNGGKLWGRKKPLTEPSRENGTRTGKGNSTIVVKNGRIGKGNFTAAVNDGSCVIPYRNGKSSGRAMSDGSGGTSRFHQVEIQRQEEQDGIAARRRNSDKSSSTSSPSLRGFRGLHEGSKTQNHDDGIINTGIETALSSTTVANQTKHRNFVHKTSQIKTNDSDHGTNIDDGTNDEVKKKNHQLLPTNQQCNDVIDLTAVETSSSDGTSKDEKKESCNNDTYFDDACYFPTVTSHRNSYACHHGGGRLEEENNKTRHKEEKHKMESRISSRKRKRNDRSTIRSNDIPVADNSRVEYGTHDDACDHPINEIDGDDSDNDDDDKVIEEGFEYFPTIVRFISMSSVQSQHKDNHSKNRRKRQRSGIATLDTNDSQYDTSSKQCTNDTKFSGDVSKDDVVSSPERAKKRMCLGGNSSNRTDGAAVNLVTIRQFRDEHDESSVVEGEQKKTLLVADNDFGGTEGHDDYDHENEHSALPSSSNGTKVGNNDASFNVRNVRDTIVKTPGRVGNMDQKSLDTNMGCDRKQPFTKKDVLFVSSHVEKGKSPPGTALEVDRLTGKSCNEFLSTVSDKHEQDNKRMDICGTATQQVNNDEDTLQDYFVYVEGIMRTLDIANQSMQRGEVSSENTITEQAGKGHMEISTDTNITLPPEIVVDEMSLNRHVSSTSSEAIGERDDCSSEKSGRCIDMESEEVVVVAEEEVAVIETPLNRHICSTPSESTGDNGECSSDKRDQSIPMESEEASFVAEKEAVVTESSLCTHLSLTPPEAEGDSGDISCEKSDRSIDMKLGESVTVAEEEVAEVAVEEEKQQGDDKDESMDETPDVQQNNDGVISCTGSNNDSAERNKENTTPGNTRSKVRGEAVVMEYSDQAKSVSAKASTSTTDDDAPVVDTYHEAKVTAVDTISGTPYTRSGEKKRSFPMNTASTDENCMSHDKPAMTDKSKEAQPPGEAQKHSSSNETSNISGEQTTENEFVVETIIGDISDDNRADDESAGDMSVEVVKNAPDHDNAIDSSIPSDEVGDDEEMDAGKSECIDLDAEESDGEYVDPDVIECDICEVDDTQDTNEKNSARARLERKRQAARKRERMMMGIDLGIPPLMSTVRPQPPKFNVRTHIPASSDSPVERGVPETQGDSCRTASTGPFWSATSCKQMPRNSSVSSNDSQTNSQTSRQRKMLEIRRFSVREEYNYLKTQKAAFEEQERLFREAATKARQAEFARTGVPTFTQPVDDVTALDQNHWKWKDPYSRLGLPQSSSLALISKQYRKLARLYHPDKSRSHASLERFLAVKEAYEDLVRNGG